jgi:hypothetical protein
MDITVFEPPPLPALADVHNVGYAIGIEAFNPRLA